METKHTKGEWIVGMKSEHYGWVNINSEKGIIARSFHGDIEPIVTIEEAEANAKLIASAPDLLEACMESKAMYEAQGINESSRIGGKQYAKLLKAINKATK